MSNGKSAVRREVQALAQQQENIRSRLADCNTRREALHMQLGDATLRKVTGEGEADYTKLKKRIADVEEEYKDLELALDTVQIRLATAQTEQAAADYEAKKRDVEKVLGERDAALTEAATAITTLGHAVSRALACNVKLTTVVPFGRLDGKGIKSGELAKALVLEATRISNVAPLSGRFHLPGAEMTDAINWGAIEKLTDRLPFWRDAILAAVSAEDAPAPAPRVALPRVTEGTGGQAMLNSPARGESISQEEAAAMLGPRHRSLA